MRIDKTVPEEHASVSVSTGLTTAAAAESRLSLTSNSRPSDHETSVNPSLYFWLPGENFSSQMSN